MSKRKLVYLKQFLVMNYIWHPKFFWKYMTCQRLKRPIQSSVHSRRSSLLFCVLSRRAGQLRTWFVRASTSCSNGGMGQVGERPPRSPFASLVSRSCGLRSQPTPDSASRRDGFFFLIPEKIKAKRAPAMQVTFMAAK